MAQALQTQPKFHVRTPKREKKENGGGRGKNAKFCAPNPRAPHFVCPPWTLLGLLFKPLLSISYGVMCCFPVICCPMLSGPKVVWGKSGKTLSGPEVVTFFSVSGVGHKWYWPKVAWAKSGWPKAVKKKTAQKLTGPKVASVLKSPASTHLEWNRHPSPAGHDAPTDKEQNTQRKQWPP